MNNTSQARVILCTAPDKAVATQLARQIVERRLAACVTILPGATSVYQWQGELCEEQELQLIVKTSNQNAASVIAALKQAHPYEVPELIQLEIGGDADYLHWIKEVCAQN